MLPFFLCTWALLAQALGEVAVCDHGDTCEPQPAVGANGLLQSKQRTARLDVEGGHRVNVRKSADGKSAVVEFQHQGRQHSYKLEAHSVYSVGAKVRRWTADGEKLEDPPPTRTFVSRKHGAWANARLHEDGSVSGLFHHQGALLEVQPEGSELALSLIDSKDTSGVSYRIQRHNASEVLGTRMRTQRKLVHGGMLAADSSLKPHGDGTGVENEPSDPLPGDFAREWDADWGGDRWYPGCYPNDDKPHIFKVSVVTDYKAHTHFQSDGAAVQAALELAFTQSNIVWENQMHIQLVIDDMTLTETNTGVPDWAKDTCPVDSWGFNSGVAGKLKSLYDWGQLPFSGATHIFTGCTNMGGAAGAAWEGHLCKSGKSNNLGTNAISYHGSSQGLWKLFSHELGHNFHAAHSFEEGQGKTGGIMDYGNGLHDGVMQFNSQYRKAEVCNYISARQNVCESNGKMEVSTMPAPMPAPVPAPVPSPTPVPVEDGEGPPGPPGLPGVRGNQGPPGPPR